MSTATATPSMRSTPRRAPGRVPLGRLAGVELRKAVDTRAGMWMLLAIAAVSAAVAVVAALSGSARHSFAALLGDTVQGAEILLPVVGTLLVASEFSQRTSLSTFTLTPDRGRVLMAKVVAGIAVALAVFAGCVAASAVAVAAAGEPFGSVPGWVLSGGVLRLVVAMLTGIAFGVLLRGPAPAIVASFVIPIGLGALGSLDAVASATSWIDPAQSLDVLVDHALDATGWAHAAVTIVVWTLGPLLAGAWRLAWQDIG